MSNTQCLPSWVCFLKIPYFVLWNPIWTHLLKGALPHYLCLIKYLSKCLEVARRWAHSARKRHFWNGKRRLDELKWKRKGSGWGCSAVEEWLARTHRAWSWFQSTEGDEKERRGFVGISGISAFESLEPQGVACHSWSGSADQCCKQSLWNLFKIFFPLKYGLASDITSLECYFL